MLDGVGVSPDLGLFLLVLWATAGLTVVHVGVLAARLFRRRRLVPDEDEGPRATITFVVPVYNDGATVGPTIESILRQSSPVERILVVDDGSTDNTPSVLETFRARGVDILRLPTNRGKSRALDAALQRVTTELVAITDADSIVDKDYVKHIQRSFRDRELAAVAGTVESIPHTWVTASRQLEYMLTVRIDRDAEHDMGALVVLPGVSTTYRTAILKKMGFEFDTIAEDFDLTFRMQRAGHRIAMNMRAKVFTSDPPTLRAYYRQLMRWYTDFFLVVKKHRSVIGKRVFGTVELPLLLLNSTASSLLFFALPVWMAFQRPEGLVVFVLTSLIFDLVLVLIAWRYYRRMDVFWAILSRFPTRVLSRFAFLFAMTRVAVGRPGLAWTKLERRHTDAFLASAAADRPEVPLVARPQPDALGLAAQTLGFGLLAAGALVAQLGLLPLALALLAVGLTFLALRSLDVNLRASAGRPPKAAALVALEMGYLAVAALALQAIPTDIPLAWRLAGLAMAGQVLFLGLGWPTRAAAWRSAGGQACTLATSVFLLTTGALGIALAVYAAGFALLASGARLRPPPALAAMRAAGEAA